MSSLKAQVVTNILGQLYVAAIGIVMIPAYVHYMGMEAYGLISFFAALQAWFFLLDMGISPTLIRELSRFRAGAIDAAGAWRFIRSSEWIFLGLGGICCLLIVLAGNWIAEHWLQLREIQVEEAANCIRMMGLMVGGRWLTSLYRSGLVGMNRLPAVNLVAVLLATLRSVTVLLVLAHYSTRTEVFFAYQVVVTTLEFILFRGLFYRVMPGAAAAPFQPDFSSLHTAFRFAGAMALLAIIWGVIGQMDRLVLSHYLNLADFGRYTVALVAASSVTMLATPFTQALQPRLVFLAAGHDDQGIRELYRSSTQALVWLLTVVAGSAVFLGESILWAWTGDPALAKQATGILTLYSLGNALLALSSLVFQLQYARGSVRRHIVGSLLFAALWVPSIYFLAIRYGAEGAAWSWMIGNLVFFAGWMLGTQNQLMPGITRIWLLGDVLRGPLLCLPIGILAMQVGVPTGNRFLAALAVGGWASLIGIAGIWASPRLKNLLTSNLRPLLNRFKNRPEDCKHNP